MKVILTQDVKNFGRKGEVKEASQGYANNFLFANKLAVPATNQSLSKLADKKKSVINEEEKFKIKLKELQDSDLIFKLKVGDKGEIFNSLKKEDIEQRLNKLGLTASVFLDKPIRALGEVKVTIGIGRGVKGDIKITIIKE